jgi:hypothetical protein
VCCCASAAGPLANEWCRQVSSSHTREMPSPSSTIDSILCFRRLEASGRIHNSGSILRWSVVKRSSVSMYRMTRNRASYEGTFISSKRAEPCLAPAKSLNRLRLSRHWNLRTEVPTNSSWAPPLATSRPNKRSVRRGCYTVLGRRLPVRHWGSW